MEELVPEEAYKPYHVAIVGSDGLQTVTTIAVYPTSYINAGDTYETEYGLVLVQDIHRNVQPPLIIGRLIPYGNTAISSVFFAIADNGLKRSTGYD